MALGEFLEAGGYAQIFVDRYLIPMAGAVWSMAPEVMPMFPAQTLVRFMQNHGMLGINTHPKWKVIRGGSHTYFAPLTRPFRERITRSAITSIARAETGVKLEFQDRPAQTLTKSCSPVTEIRFCRCSPIRPTPSAKSWRVSGHPQ